MLLILCAIFNGIRYLNDCLAKRGIIVIKMTATISDGGDDEGALPSYYECIAPPPAYDDIAASSSAAGGGYSSLIPLTSISTGSELPDSSDNVTSDVTLQMSSDPL